MRRLIWGSSFRRALKQIERSNRQLHNRILDVLVELQQDPYLPKLRAHKLTGPLEGLWACSVAYDCRIVFAFEPDSPYADAIELIDVGTHEDVY